MRNESNLLVQGATDHRCTMYRNRTVFDRRPKPTEIPLVHPQRIRENYFKLRETPQKGAFEGFWKGEGLARGRVEGKGNGREVVK